MSFGNRPQFNIIPWDDDGYSLSVIDGAVPPLEQPGFISVGYDGANLRFIRTDSSGHQILVGAGSAGTPAGGVISVQGVSGGTAIAISDGAGSITVDGTVTANQGTAVALSGGWPVKITDGTNVLATISNPIRIDPTGTTAQPVTDNGGSITIDTTQLPSSLVGGRLDINLGSWLGSTAPTVGQKTLANSIPIAIASDQSAIPITDNGGSLTVDGTVTANQGTAAAVSGAWPIKVTDGTNTAAVKAASTAATTTDPSLVVALSPNTPPQPPSNRQVNGTISALNGAVTISAQGLGNIGVSVTGTWIATLVFEGTIDGTNWFSMSGFPFASGVVGVTSTTTNGQWRITASGVAQFRVRASAYTSGTATVYLDGTQTASTVRAAQGAPNTQENSWPIQISDGYTGPVAVTPASTSPAASDKALVVVISPNQQAIPTTSAAATANTGIRSGQISLGGGTVNSQQAIRATTYTEPTSAAQRSISSSSANDTSAGTGARQVQITYYTGTGAGPFTETITLNGTSAVNTVATNIQFIEQMIVVSVGSGLYNAGTITLWTSTGGAGTAIGTIGSGNLAAGQGDNQTLWAHHYIPQSKTASLATFIVSATSGGSGTNAKYFLKSKDVLTSTAPEIIISDLLLTIGSITRTLGIPIKVSGFSRITAYGVPGVNNATLVASFDYSEQ